MRQLRVSVCVCNTRVRALLQESMLRTWRHTRHNASLFPNRRREPRCGHTRRSLPVACPVCVCEMPLAVHMLIARTKTANKQRLSQACQTGGPRVVVAFFHVSPPTRATPQSRGEAGMHGYSTLAWFVPCDAASRLGVCVCVVSTRSAQVLCVCVCVSDPRKKALTGTSQTDRHFIT
jgi:hypothetical protein